MNISSDTLEDEVEPFLLRIGFVIRGSRGRTVTAKAYQHLAIEPPAGDAGQGMLFDE